MGTAASILAAEIARPADASDVDCHDSDAARVEIVRLRQLVAHFGVPASDALSHMKSANSQLVNTLRNDREEFKEARASFQTVS